MSEDYDALVAKYDNDTKLDIAAWVISKIDEHGDDPGSFRYLIYNRLGFGPEAYVPLYEAGGMNITNELDYNYKNDLAELLQKQGIDNPKLKNFAGVCDESECWNVVSCGWPTKDGGYRHTCHKHSSFKG